MTGIDARWARRWVFSTWTAGLGGTVSGGWGLPVDAGPDVGDGRGRTVGEGGHGSHLGDETADAQARAPAVASTTTNGSRPKP